MLFAFGLGVLVTLAEPALKVMGQKVEETTSGRFSSQTLILAVAFGLNLLIPGKLVVI